MGTTPRIKAYKVAAVFEIGMSEYDASIVFMPLTEAQAYFNRTGDVTAIEVYTDNPDKSTTPQAGDRTPPGGRSSCRLAAAQRHLLQRAAGRAQRHVPDPDADRAGRGAQHHLGLIMLVKDKGRDIAILRTMGATRARSCASS